MYRDKTNQADMIYQAVCSDDTRSNFYISTGPLDKHFPRNLA